MNKTVSLTIISFQLSVDIVANLFPFGYLVSLGFLCVLIHYMKAKHYIEYILVSLFFQLLSNQTTQVLWFFSSPVMETAIRTFAEVFTIAMPIVIVVPYLGSFLIRKFTNIYKRLGSVKSN